MYLGPKRIWGETETHGVSDLHLSRKGVVNVFSDSDSDSGSDSDWNWYVLRMDVCDKSEIFRHIARFREFTSV